MGELSKWTLYSVRWFAAEFLRIPMRLEVVSILTGVCRLAGCTVIASLLYFQLHQPNVSTFTYAALAEGSLAVLISLMMGNLVKELLFTASEHVAAWFGRDFNRRGYTLSGKKFRETVHVDGTWIRCGSSRHGTVCEWTDASGRCSKVITSHAPPDKERRR
jgi:hypothetical protein